MVKIFGIGNILLGDDGIGVKVVEEIKSSIDSLNKDVEVIIGETDYLYCINKIDKRDIVIIVDGSYLNMEPGKVEVRRLEECDGVIKNSLCQHNESLIWILRRELKEVKGYVVTVEVSKIEYSLELSQEIKNQLPRICYEVLNMCKDIIIENAK